MGTRILGIDPGSRAAGWGVVETDGPQLRALDHGVIRVDADASLGVRLTELYRRVGEVLGRYDPAEVVIEQVFTARNVRSALVLGHARGVLLLAAAGSGCEVHEYAPRAVKKAVAGYGQADKVQVAEMVQSLLGLPKRPAQDAADALALAICHAPSRGIRRKVEAAGGKAPARGGGGRGAWAAAVLAAEERRRQ